MNIKKKIILSSMMALLMSSAALFPLPADAALIPTTTVAHNKSVESELLLSRLNEIKAMDKSNLSSPEKRQLRKEVRSIRSQLNTQGNGGIYLSAGAIIIIVLLLIILL